MLRCVGSPASIHFWPPSSFLQAPNHAQLPNNIHRSLRLLSGLCAHLIDWMHRIFLFLVYMCFSGFFNAFLCSVPLSFADAECSDRLLLLLLLSATAMKPATEQIPPMRKPLLIDSRRNLRRVFECKNLVRTCRPVSCGAVCARRALLTTPLFSSHTLPFTHACGAK